MKHARRIASLLLLGTLAACQQYRTPEQMRDGSSGEPIVLTSQSMTLPDEKVTLPASADIVTANCTACHSPELILTQPKLKPEQWLAEVTKMRGAYKATIDEKDDARIVAALLTLQSGTPQK